MQPSSSSREACFPAKSCQSPGVPSRAALALGSNLGDRHGTLRGAVSALSGVLDEIRCAPFYETLPQGFIEQGNFINTCVTGFYAGEPEALLAEIQSIEKQFGRNREREIRWGPRTLDIDIILFGDLILKTDLLEIPHPRCKERAFVLRPLLDLLPDAKDPVTGEPFAATLARLGEAGIVFQPTNQTSPACR